MSHLFYQHPTDTTLTVTTDASVFQVALVHRFLSEESYWAGGTDTRETAELLADGLNYGLFHQNEQIGFASVTTDFSSFAYISDVFVVEKHQGQGLATWLLECILSHPRLSRLPNWMLLTKGEHKLYEKMGFRRVPGSKDQMIRHNRKQQNQ